VVKEEETPRQNAEKRQDMLKRSSEKAKKQHEARQPSEKELEEIKRAAALEAIRRQMELWRTSVMVDRRLTPEAKTKALQRIDLLEKKLLIQESIRWDGLSLAKIIALATIWVQEVVNSI